MSEMDESRNWLIKFYLIKIKNYEVGKKRTLNKLLWIDS